ncbi:MAG: hypothetical protein DWQ30_02395 [Acidobacteria bacterium]|nr:MAG: hypothetical protein DWQ30_02395 [Acidobacteriota bacterium]
MSRTSPTCRMSSETRMTRMTRMTHTARGSRTDTISSRQTVSRATEPVNRQVTPPGPPERAVAMRLRRLAPIVALPMLLGSLAAAPLSAQLESAGEGPVAMGHLHVNTADAEASLRFWSELLGGEPKRLGPLEVVALPDLLVVLTRREPSAGSVGSSVNHVGVQVPDVAALVERLRAAGVPVRTGEHVPTPDVDVFEVPDQEPRVAFVDSPEGTRVELFENRALERPVENHHLHFFVDDPIAARDWYVERFGAVARRRGSFESADLPGVNLTFSQGETVGTEGRAIDHIGFEVDDLEGLVERLEASGVVFTRPLTRIDALGLAFAFFTDPWGTYVELTEGLDAL